MRKASWNRLRKLWYCNLCNNVDENMVVEGHHLSSMKSSSLEELAIEYLPFNDEQCPNLSWIIKLKKILRLGSILYIQKSEVTKG